MNCSDLQQDLNALLDGELSPGRTPKVLEHLASCPACAKTLSELAHLRAALAASIREEDVSVDLLAKIETALDAESADANNVVSSEKRAPRRRWTWIGAGVAIAAGLVLVFWPHDDKSLDLMGVRDAAVRASMIQTGTDQKAGPSVPSVDGFQRVSGRTDVVAGHRAQVFVYKGLGDTITLSIWPANGEAAHATRKANYQGAEIQYWNDGTREFWAESPHPDSAALDRFVRAMQSD